MSKEQWVWYPVSSGAHYKEFGAITILQVTGLQVINSAGTKLCYAVTFIKLA